MKSSPTVGGALYKANAEGFKRMIAEANRVTRDGYELLTVIPLGEQIGCVFRRRSEAAEVESAHHDSFFE